MTGIWTASRIWTPPRLRKPRKWLSRAGAGHALQSDMSDQTALVARLEARIANLEAELARERARSSRWWRATLVYALKIVLTITVAYLTARGCAPPSRPTPPPPGEKP